MEKKHREGCFRGVRGAVDGVVAPAGRPHDNRRMAAWLSPWISADGTDVPTVCARFAAAIAGGLVVAAIHRGSRAGHRVSASFPGTLVMLCVLIAMVAQVIGENVALAFSLVGALSIVRFRTVVQDTKDTAFVIFAVAVGMAIGAGHALVATGGLVAAGAVAWLFRDQPRDRAGRDQQAFDLRVRLDRTAADDTEARVRETLAHHTATTEQTACRTAKKGAMLEVVYRARLSRGAPPHLLVSALTGIEGVRGVDLRRTGEAP